LRWCTQRRRAVVEFWLALASAVIVCGRLVRRAWTHDRWDARPAVAHNRLRAQAYRPLQARERHHLFTDRRGHRTIDYGSAIVNSRDMTADDGGATRSYRSTLREEQARRTRRRILDAAREAFVARGYAGTTVRAIAAAAGVSVPTVELLFGTKAAVLKAAIDVAIAGDDEPVPVLDRAWTEVARRAPGAEELLAVVAGVLGPAQARSAGLVLAALEASVTDPELAVLSQQLVSQRETTAGWIVDTLAAKAPLRSELSRQQAVETLWLLMDPAVFVRLTGHRQWSLERYQDWVARSVRNLLIPDAPHPPPRSRRARTTKETT
jgi:TetR/AcrR family transcriptional regulator, regulator of autoinduction and epiphytic fitness